MTLFTCDVTTYWKILYNFMRLLHMVTSPFVIAFEQGEMKLIELICIGSQSDDTFVAKPLSSTDE